MCIITAHYADSTECTTSDGKLDMLTTCYKVFMKHPLYKVLSSTCIAPCLGAAGHTSPSAADGRETTTHADEP